MLDMNETQRRDINALQDNTLSTVIDEHNKLTSPYIFNLFNSNEIIGNNWIIGEDEILKYNLADDDSLTFRISQDALTQKDVTDVKISFDVECDRDGAVVDNVKLSNGFVEYSFLTETVLNDSSHIDIDCQKFGLDAEVLNNCINDGLFDIIVCFDGKSLNTNMIITNPRLSFTFKNKLQGEIEVVKNRLGDLDSDIIGIATFHIDENGHLIASFPTSDKNNYYIDENGHLIYDTENYHNEGLIT